MSEEPEESLSAEGLALDVKANGAIKLRQKAINARQQAINLRAQAAEAISKAEKREDDAATYDAGADSLELEVTGNW